MSDCPVDVAAGSIDDFHARLRERKRKFSIELFVLDCFRVSRPRGFVATLLIRSPAIHPGDSETAVDSDV